MRRDIHIASATGSTIKRNKETTISDSRRAALPRLLWLPVLHAGSRNDGEGFRAMQMRLGLPMSTAEQRPVPPSQPYYFPDRSTGPQLAMHIGGINDEQSHVGRDAADFLFRLASSAVVCVRCARRLDGPDSALVTTRHTRRNREKEQCRLHESGKSRFGMRQSTSAGFVLPLPYGHRSCDVAASTNKKTCRQIAAVDDAGVKTRGA